MNRTKLILTGLLLQLTSCYRNSVGSNLNYIDKKFTGFWAETEWTYEFRKDGHFQFKSAGHYDFAEYSGTYIILDSLIFTNPDSDWQLFDGVIKSRLKIINSNCIRDYDNNFYCLSIDTIEKLNEREFDFQEIVLSLLDTLPITKTKKDKLKLRIGENDFDSTKIEFIYDGIIIDKKRELHLFKLQKSDLREIRTYESYLVNKNPFEIYQHTPKRDSLILIYTNAD